MSAIQELIEAVETGRQPAKDEWRAIFPDLPDDDDYHRCHMAFAANQGWSDAACALHDAVVPSAAVHIAYSAGKASCVLVVPTGDKAMQTFSAGGPSIGRAWLLCILKALATTTEGEV